MALLLPDLVVYQLQSNIFLAAVTPKTGIYGSATEFGGKHFSLQLDDFLVEETKSFSCLLELQSRESAQSWMFGECRASQSTPIDTIKGREHPSRLKMLTPKGAK